jgi:hypothetical protein
MSFDIFQVDWILVDSIIIIILIIFLCFIKGYKYKNRWRNNITNRAIDEYFLNPPLDSNNENNFIRKCRILRKNSSKENKNKLPTIFLFSSKSKNNLIYAFAEGLCSFGFTVIQIVMKRKLFVSNKSKSNFYRKNQEIIKNLFNHLAVKQYFLNHNYWIINFTSNIPLNGLINKKSKQIGLILINPSLDKFSIEKISSWFDSEFQVEIYSIFSEKYFCNFKNRKLTKFKATLSHMNPENVNLFTLEGANIFFKNKETILLAKTIILIRNIAYNK